MIRPALLRSRRLALAACLVLPFTTLAGAQRTAAKALTPGELRAGRALDAAKKQGAPELYAFLKRFPKGGELHMHLGGAVYAETFIAEGAREGLCVAPVDPGSPAVPEAKDAVRFAPPQNQEPGHCVAGQVPAADALSRQPLYDDLIDSFSMRAFVPTEGINGHDQFFATFDRFGGLKGEAGEWLDEVVTRAAAQNEQYLEIMQTPTFSHAAALGYKLGWPADLGAKNYMERFAGLRDKLLSAGLRDEIATDRKELSDAEIRRRALEQCNSSPGGARVASRGYLGPTAQERRAACDVKIHWLYQILRGFPPQQVFAEALLGFEVASADPDVVGLNFVMPEDGRISMQDYHLQMLMLDYLHSVYPGIHISLHAGELAPGQVPPTGLSFHIREAVELGHAERIGHGVDVLYEEHPYELLKEMAQNHIAVEVNLTSNDVILGVKGSDHPLHAYMAAHVPFALSTDDEGVSRIDLTHEYVRAVMDQNLSYADLKSSARNALEYSFLPGRSLYSAVGDYTRRHVSCAESITAASTPSAACEKFIRANEKAAEQYELERRFASFEAGVR